MFIRITHFRFFAAIILAFCFVAGFLSLQPSKADASWVTKCSAKVILHEDSSWSGTTIWANGVKFGDRFEVVHPHMQGTSWQDANGTYFGVPWPIAIDGVKCKVNLVQ